MILDPKKLKNPGQTLQFSVHSFPVLSLSTQLSVWLSLKLISHASSFVSIMTLESLTSP